jgi:hypothetical protein
LIRRLTPLLVLLIALVAGCQRQRHWAGVQATPIGPYEKLSDRVQLTVHATVGCQTLADGRFQFAFRDETGCMGMLILPAELSKAGLTDKLVEDRGALYGAPGKAAEAGLQMLLHRPSPGAEGVWLRAWAGPYRCRLTQTDGGARGSVELDAWCQGQYGTAPLWGVSRVTVEFDAPEDPNLVTEVAAALQAGGAPEIPKDIERFWMTPEEIVEHRRRIEERRRKWLGLPVSRPAPAP